MLRQSEVAEVFNHSKLCTASCLVYTDEGARRKCVRERWVGGAKGKEGREDDWEGKDIGTGQAVNWNTLYSIT